MSGTALTLAAIAAFVVDPACGAVRVDSPAGERFARHVVATVARESGRDPYVIGVNGPGGGPLRSANAAEAATKARALVAAGRSIDLGLGQINDRNLSRHGLTFESAFNPCHNVAAAARHLAGDVRHVLALASRRYNTGSTERGDTYAQGVTALEAALPPDLVPSATLRTPGTASASGAVSPPESRPPVSPFVKRAAGRSFTYGNQAPEE